MIIESIRKLTPIEVGELISEAGRTTCCRCEYWCLQSATLDKVTDFPEKFKKRERNQTRIVGECRRNAPVRIHNADDGWPYTQHFHWCGEFSPIDDSSEPNESELDHGDN